MNVVLDEVTAFDKHVPMRELVAAIQQTLARNHQKILAAALSDWQRKYAGKDPSDACATVHIAPIALSKSRKQTPSYQKLVRTRRPKSGGSGRPGR